MIVAQGCQSPVRAESKAMALESPGRLGTGASLRGKAAEAAKTEDWHDEDRFGW
jgi:hypothetical protein